MRTFKGKWESFFGVKLPDEIINRKLDYNQSFLRFIENVLNIPISYFYIFVEKYENEFNMRITLRTTNSRIIYQLRDYHTEHNYGLYEETIEVLRSKNPDLKLELTILKNDRDLFELDENKVIIYVNGEEENIIPYFKEIIKLYFREFVHKTLMEVVYLTSGKYPISEKNFIEKYSYILEDIKKEIRKKII